MEAKASYCVRVFAVPEAVVATTAALINGVVTVLHSIGAEFTDADRVEVQAPSSDSAGWVFAVVGHGTVDREAFRAGMVDHFGVCTEIDYDDRFDHNLHWFRHDTRDGRFELGSTGPYLCGDVARIRVDYPQRGRDNVALRALRARDRSGLTVEELAAVADDQHAVRIGIAMFYDNRLRPLGLRHDRYDRIKRELPVELLELDAWAMPTEELDAFNACLAENAPEDLDSFNAWRCNNAIGPGPTSSFEPVSAPMKPVESPYSRVVLCEPVENPYGRVVLCDLNTLVLRDEGRPHRARLFPSPKDFIMVASRGLASYRVLTPYVYDSHTRTVCRTSSTDPADRIEYEITSAHCVGVDPHSRSLYHAIIKGRAGQQLIFRAGVEIVADASGRDGRLEMFPASDN